VEVRDIIHFVHGNGFPSSCYRQLFLRLENRFDCIHLDKVGHSPNFPVTVNWEHLVNEVIFSIQSQTSKPVIAVGHSLGGVLSLLASIRQPSLFKAVIMLDSPLLGRLKSVFLRISRAIGMIDSVTPASKTRTRRRQWSTREEALTYLQSRGLFKFFDGRCLQDYIDYGMDKNESGYFLRFDPQIEYQIYRTIPDSCYEHEGQLQRPTALIYGSRSHLIRPTELRYMQKKYGIVCFKMDGTHMLPFEHPDSCARLIMNVIDTLTRSE
jgi:pimeloyl-ACP methyl ester carboxylesterase